MQKKRMKKSREKNPKLKIIIIVALVGIIMVVMLPFIINYIYVQNVKSDFWNVDYNIGDILLYYGGLFTFAGTSILGIMTYFQNEKLQDKSEEVNRLQMELQKRSMLLAEKQYNQNIQDSNMFPKFEIKLSSYSGNYGDISISVRNVTTMIVSGLRAIEFRAECNDAIILSTKEIWFEKNSLEPGKDTIVKMKNKEIIKEVSNQGWIRNVEYYDDVKLIFEFSCEDEKCVTHYYRASVVVSSTKEFVKDTWVVKKIG